MKLDDKMIEKMSKRLAEIAKNRKSTYQTEQQKSNVKDNYKEEMLPFSRTSEIQKVQIKKNLPTNQQTENSFEINIEQKSESMQNQQEIDEIEKIEFNANSQEIAEREKKKKQDEKVMKAISLAMKSRNSAPKNGENITQKKETSQVVAQCSSLNRQESPHLKQLSFLKESFSHQNLMPKVSTMNNLLKLSKKLTPEKILAYMKTLSQSQKVSPIRLLTHFCVERVMFFIWNSNGIQQMENKLKNPLQEKSFLCEQILKGVTDLLNFFKNLEKPLINKVLTTVFQRLGLFGLYFESWFPSCVQANLNVFQKIGANTKELLKTSKSRTISSNIFNQISPLEKTIDFSHLGLNLENEQKSQQRIDELDSCNIQNKLFFYNKSKKQKNKIAICKKTENQAKADFIKTNFKQKKGKIQKLVTNVSFKKKKNYEQNINKNQTKSKNYKTKEFSISLRRLKCPWNAKVFTSQNDEEGFFLRQRNAKQMPIKNVLQEQQSIEFFSQKRTRPAIKEFPFSLKMEEQEDTDLILVSKSQIKRYLQEHMFSNIDHITSMIINGCKMNPDSVLKTLKQSTVSKSQPVKMKEFQANLEHQKKEKEGSSKNKVIASRSSTRNKNGIQIKKQEQQISQNEISFHDKQLIALVEKTSFDLQRKGKSLQQIINELFNILDENGVSNCQEKKRILNEWLKRRQNTGK